MHVPDFICEAWADLARPLDCFAQFGLHRREVLLGEKAAVDDHPAAVGHHRRGPAAVIGGALGLPAVDGIDVEGRGARRVGDHRHGGAARGEGGHQVGFDRAEDPAHVAHGAIAQERHRAVGDAAEGLDLGPPDPAMAEADPVLVQRLGDDDVLHPRRVEMAAFGQPGDAAIAAGFLVGGGGDLDRAGMVGTQGEERLDGDDRRGEPAFHVARAAAVDPAVDRAPRRRDRSSSRGRPRPRRYGR